MHPPTHKSCGARRAETVPAGRFVGLSDSHFGRGPHLTPSGPLAEDITVFALDRSFSPATNVLLYRIFFSDHFCLFLFSPHPYPFPLFPPVRVRRLGFFFIESIPALSRGHSIRERLSLVISSLMFPFLQIITPMDDESPRKHPGTSGGHQQYISPPVTSFTALCLPGRFPSGRASLDGFFLRRVVSSPDPVCFLVSPFLLSPSPCFSENLNLPAPCLILAPPPGLPYLED